MKSTIGRKGRSLAFHPLVFATFPILSLFVQNMGKGYLGEAMLLTAGALVLCVVIWVLVKLLVKDTARSAILVSAFFLLFLSFGHVLSATAAILDRVGLLDRWWVLIYGSAADLGWLIFWSLLFVAVAFYVLSRLKNVRMATDFLNLAALALVAMLAVNFFAAGGFSRFVQPYVAGLTQNASEADNAPNPDSGPQELQDGSSSEMTDTPTDLSNVPTYGYAWLETLPVGGSTTDAPPDIYYIILDMYARSDVLSSVFSYDNSEFLSFLEDRGFYVARQSRSNYHVTVHSLASSLNYTYLNDLATHVGPIYSWSLSAAMIGNSRLFNYLENRGYKTVSFATGYWFTELTDSDVYLEPAQVQWNPSEFQEGLIELTPISKIAVVHATKDQVARRRVLFTLDHLADTTTIDGPTLVFAHINSPHSPWVFEADGRPVASKTGYTYEDYVEAYRGQVIFTTQKAQEAIAEILTRSPEPPIIIVQGDHGTCYVSCDDDPTERVSILNAYYFPDQDYRDLYQTITPVNTFRVVLNKFFGANYDLLDDRTYYYYYPATPYDFVDVTEQVSSGP